METHRTAGQHLRHHESILAGSYAVEVFMEHGYRDRGGFEIRPTILSFVAKNHIGRGSTSRIGKATSNLPSYSY